MESRLRNKGGMAAVLAPALVILAGSLWGSMGLFVHILTDMGLDSFQVAALRSFTAAILMVAVLLVWRRSLLRFHLKDIWCFLGTGLFSVVFFNCCYFTNITITSMSTAAVLLYTAPSIVMVLSAWLFHESINVRKILALLLAFLGCMFVTGLIGSEVMLTPKVILLGLGSGLGYALYSIFSRYALEKGYHPLTIIAWTFVFSSVGIFPFIKTGPILQAVTGGIEQAGFIFLFGLVSTMLPYVVYTIGLQHMENSRASIMASVEPVVATLIGTLVYKEPLTFHGIVGMALVLLSIIICNVHMKHRGSGQL